MLKNLLARLGLGARSNAARASAAAAQHGAAPPGQHASGGEPVGAPDGRAPQPYTEPHLNFLYNLLFCDDVDLFRRSGNAPADEPWRTLLASDPSPAGLRRIADDPHAESRLRALAFRRLREIGFEVPAKILLGTIVEVPLERGLDTLAAFGDGRVRYINQSGAASIFEGGPAIVETLARELIVASLPLVQRIGPWDGARLAPPPRGTVRLSFVVSEGLYFGQGTFAQLQKDPLGAPVLAKAGELLEAVVAAAQR